METTKSRKREVTAYGERVNRKEGKRQE
jgi:hypothetical protein